jgi:DNA invertase Pin-like site-specific DNA recombinase
MAPLLIGYARVSTDEQDLTAQREALVALGGSVDRVHATAAVSRHR